MNDKSTAGQHCEIPKVNEQEWGTLSFKQLCNSVSVTYPVCRLEYSTEGATMNGRLVDKPNTMVDTPATSMKISAVAGLSESSSLTKSEASATGVKKRL